MSSANGSAEHGSRFEGARRVLSDRPELMLIVILLLLLVGSELAQPGFLSARQLSNLLFSAAPLALLAAANTLVMLTGGIDLSVAATATAAAYMLTGQGTQGTPRAILVALGVGLAVGLVNGIGVGVFRVNALIMTLGMSAIVVGALTLYAQRSNVPLVPDAIRELGGGTVATYVPKSLFLWGVISALIILGLRYSGFGRMVYAVGDNPVACRLAGVRVWQVLIATYAAAGVLSALAGILLVGLTNAADLGLAIPFLLPSIAAVVVGGTSIFGGTGGYGGTIFGVLILTVLDTLLNLLQASQSLKQILYGAIIIGLASLYARTSSSE